MGQVYLAEDTQLLRRVALKILPADLAANRDRMRRFVQEAQAAAALNHPNIGRPTVLGRLRLLKGEHEGAREAFAHATTVVHEIAAHVDDEKLRATFLNSSAVREVLNESSVDVRR